MVPTSETYEVLGDSELNVSWHCLICNNPNYSTTVHDLFSNEMSYCSTSIGSVPDISVSSPDPTKHQTQTATCSFLHSCQKELKQTKLKVPLRVLNINFQSIKMKQCRLSKLIDSINPGVVFGTETWLDNHIKDVEILPEGYKIYR